MVLKTTQKGLMCLKLNKTIKTSVLLFGTFWLLYHANTVYSKHWYTTEK